MRKSKAEWTECNDEIRRLGTELFLARTAIIHLMSPEVQVVLNSYKNYTSQKDSADWTQSATAELLKFATIMEDNFQLDDRAYCPLCHRGNDSRYKTGFSYPEGLRRHLIGFGNVFQCEVTSAAFELARKSWRLQFSNAEET